MEFKGHLDTIYNTETGVLIESDWNLKTLQQQRQRKTLIVLIESDWNLKTRKERIECSMIDVLIESDWNLKSFNDGTDLFNVC